jgi:hypothetical protein
LRSALNHAFRDGLVASDAAWRKVKSFKSVDAARVRYLTVAQARRLVNASDPEFRPLVQPEPSGMMVCTEPFPNARADDGRTAMILERTRHNFGGRCRTAAHRARLHASDGPGASRIAVYHFRRAVRKSEANDLLTRYHMAVTWPLAARAQQPAKVARRVPQTVTPVGDRRVPYPCRGRGKGCNQNDPDRIQRRRGSGRPLAQPSSRQE